MTINLNTITRRDMLSLYALGGLGFSRCSWFQSLAAEASDNPKRRKSVIMLWMNGGPATIDLWDLKPNHDNGGPFNETATSVPGIKISEHLPNLAKQTKEFVIIRSMATREGDHRRARIVGVTGYTPQGAIQFPALGSLISHELSIPNANLPGFVSIGGRDDGELGGGFLGPKFSPFVVGSGNRTPGNLNGSNELKVQNLNFANDISESNFKNRLNMLNELDMDFSKQKNSSVLETLKTSTDRAIRLMRPEAASAFQLEEEKEKLRDSYGRTSFGQGCLLARRLVERGVAFVEVTLDGWDTHSNNFSSVQRLSGILDAGFSTLLEDLKQRGLLQDTIIVCQGEFGRTPRINGNKGRDHWPSSWAAVIAGGGIKGGQVVGGTSNDGTTVEGKPTRTADLIATIVKAVGIDPMKQNMSNVSRPIRIADPNGKPIQEIF